MQLCEHTYRFKYISVRLLFICFDSRSILLNFKRSKKGEFIRGVTCLDKEVFIVRHEKAEVELYDINILMEQRRLPVAVLSSPYCRGTVSGYKSGYSGTTCEIVPRMYSQCTVVCRSLCTVCM